MSKQRRTLKKGGSLAYDAVQAGVSDASFRLLTSVAPAAQKGGNSSFPSFRFHHKQQLGGNDIPLAAVHTMRALDNVPSHLPLITGSPGGPNTSYKLGGSGGAKCGGGKKALGGANGGCFSPKELKKLKAESRAVEKKLAKEKKAKKPAAAAKK